MKNPVFPADQQIVEAKTGTLTNGWWMFLSALYQRFIQLVKDAVIGGPTLTTIGAVPKVTAAGTLGESAITDTGTQVDIAAPGTVDGVTVSVKPGTLSLLETGSTTRFPFIEWRDKTAVRGAYMGWGSATVLDLTLENGRNLVISGGNAGFGGNVAPAEAVDATGNANVSGVYKVAGTQVVGARGAAVTSPTGGGTVVSAPSGGATIDIQARAAISSIITAISSSGNTVDPVARVAIDAIRARLAAGTGHGLTS